MLTEYDICGTCGGLVLSEELFIFHDECKDCHDATLNYLDDFEEVDDERCTGDK